MQYRGQCFLCLRDTTMTRVERRFPSQVRIVYVCPHCGAENAAPRVEGRRDTAGKVWEDYGPVATVQRA
jgi:hypothetical protein